MMPPAVDEQVQVHLAGHWKVALMREGSDYRPTWNKAVR